MTHAISSLSTDDCGCGTPQSSTPVLLHRSLIDGVDRDALSVFGDDRWDLSPGIFESHARGRSVNFLSCPAALRPAVKHYLWEVINHVPPRNWRRSNTDALSLLSCYSVYNRLLVFIEWLDTRGITRFDQVTSAALAQFLEHVRDLEGTPVKVHYLHEVRRLWCYRDRLPEHVCLPATPPWDGEDVGDLVAVPRRGSENATPRIHPDTMQPLLLWSLRFVQDFGDDIIAAFTEYQRLMRRGAVAGPNRLPPEQRDHQGRKGWLTSAVQAWLAERRTPLPGRRKPDGAVEVAWRHLERIFDTSASSWYPANPAHQLVANSGLPVADDAYLDTPLSGRLLGKPWRTTRIAYTEAPHMAQLLLTAAAVVVGYLSGVRPGELLSLERDCVEHDQVTGLWLMHGKQWKGVVDDRGRKLPEGQLRDDPWTVIEPVAQAVNVLQRLHDQPLLFPTQLTSFTKGRGPHTRPHTITARRTEVMNNDIAALIAWINHYCSTHNCEDERIPDDPHGRIALPRLRRTLAWHIVRRPRGLIAGAIQYGHLFVRVTLGYSGSYASGFPDDLAYEEWLYRLEQLADWEERLADGEHISGPAADAYRYRVHTASTQFAGRVLTSGQQTRDLLDNPLLQIFPGKAMTCVLNPHQALCQLASTEGNTRRTPDKSDCRPNCKNLAYTDANIAELQTRARQLREIVADPLAPSPRKARDRHELNRLETILRSHKGPV